MFQLKRVMSIFLCFTLFMTSFQTDVSAEDTSSETTDDLQTEVQSNTSENTDSSSNVSTDSSTNSIQEQNTNEFVQEYQNATFKIAFKDDLNTDQRRKDMNEMLHLYQDGVEISKTLQLLSESEENGMNIYTYSILNLPVYKENSTQEHTYTLKEDQLPGYTKLVGTYLGVDDTLSFTNNGSSFESSQVFGNELKTYNVTGTITFDEESDLDIKETLDQIFPNVVKTYDAKDAKTWTFTLDHLYTTDKNGNAASYSYDYSLEGWNVNEIAPITSDTKLEINYSKNKKEKNDSKDSKDEKSSEDSDESDPSLANAAIEYNGKKNFALNWYDGITESRSDYGKIKLTIGSETFTYTFDGSTWTTSDTSSTYDLSKIKFNLKSNSAQYQDVEITGIPSKMDGKEIQSSISYTKPDNTYKVEEKDGTYNIYKLTEYKIDIVLSNGGQTISNLHNYFHLSSGYSDLNGKLQNHDFTLSYQKTEGGKSYYSLTVSGLKEYQEKDGTKSKIIYDSVLSNISDDGTIAYKDNDKFEVTYNNTKVANYGNDTSSIKNTGELDLLLTGTTSYSGTKVWKTKEEHPNATWALWRYSKKNGVDYKQASPVSKDLNEQDVANWDAKEGGTWTVSNLPKYDTDGYEYVYFAKEYMNDSSYVRHYGTVEQDFRDDINADGQTQDEKSRNGDTSIYNGGTLTNRIESKITTTVTKEWIADYYASELNDVKVTAKLQVKKKSESTWSDYKDSKGETVTHVLDNYNVETGNPSYSMTVSKYDAEGDEVEYRWVEVKISDNGTENALSEDGTKAELTVNKNAKDGKEYFEESSNTEDNTTTLTSKLTGKTTYYIHKIWDHGKNKDLPTTLKVNLEQLGKTGDQTDSEYNTTITLHRTDQGNTDTEWTYMVEDLPKFDVDGGKFTYQATEQEVDNYVSSFTFNKKDESSDIKNVKYGYNNIFLENKFVDGPGDSQEIKVRKIWYDDGDGYQRKDISVDVLSDDGTVLGSTTFGESDNWWKKVGVTAYQYEVDGQTVTTKASDTPEEYRKTENLYKGEYTLQETFVGRYAVENNQVTTDATSYKVTYATKKGDKDYLDNYYTVINRRVGTVDLTVTKTWVDGNKEASERSSYGATVQLTSDGATINKNSVTVGDETTSITSNDGSTVVSSKQELTGEDEQKIYFYSLPKYDENGKFIEYKVKENDPDKKLSSNDYVTSINYGDYYIGNVQASERVEKNDSQAISISNRRSKTKSVKFYKLWKDKYVYNKKKRPDIYLTLYSDASKKSNGNLEVSNEITEYSPYIDRLWDATDQVKIYEWSCTFDNLPKYDVNGKEITYYATEQTHVDSASLDYEPLKYKDGLPDGSGEIKDSTNDYSKDGKMVLKEGNTFVNGLKNNIYVHGVKVWENIPKGFPLSQLPKINFVLDQYLGDTLVKEKVAYVNDVGSTSTNYNFEIGYKGENDVNGNYIGTGEAKELDKYNSEGALYTYKIREEIDESKAEQSVINGKLDGKDNYFQITNTYINDITTNVGKIIVKKDWSGLKDYAPTFKYPILTYELHRVSVDENGKKINDSDTVVESKTMDRNKNEESISFDNQLIYAPNGKKFEYYIVEKNVNGYTTKTDYGDIDHTFALDDVTKEVESSKEVEFKNTYDQYDQTSFVGLKVWDDYDNLMNNRSKSVTLTLYRKTSTINQQKVGTLTLEKDSNSFKTEENLTNKSGSITSSKNDQDWSYKIENLDKIAPDGNNWQYSIKEEKKANDYYDNGQTVGTNVKNKLTTTSITATKTWKNIADIQKENVEFTLIVKEGEDGTWQWASDYFNKDTNITYTKTITTGQSNVKFDNLPTYAKNAKDKAESKRTLVYGVRETKIGDTKVQFKGDTTEYASEANGVYNIENTSDTSVSNTLIEKKDVSLKITKKWVDQDNKYGLRDKDWTVKYHVYRKVDGGQNELVTKPDGSAAYVLSVSGKDNSNEASATLTDLPAYNAQGQAYTYWAVELNKAGSSEGSYNGAYSASMSDVTKDNDTFVQTNTNTLETTDVDVSKTWNDENVSERPDSVEFTIYQNGNKLSPETKITVSKDSDWKGTVKDLPKKDINGKEYTYTVKEDRVDGYLNPSYSKTNVTNAITSFTMDKADADGKSITDREIGFKLTGNGYEATWHKAKDGTVTTSVKKGDKVIYSGSEIKGLALGDYTLSETTIPDGYEKIDDLTVKLSDDQGTLKISSSSNKVSFANNVLTVKDTPTSITLKKVDKDSGNEIESGTAGYATFTISGEFADGSTTPIEVTSQNIESTLEGKLVVAKEYTLKETATLDSYYDQDLSATFKLDEAGNIEVLSQKLGDETVSDYVSASGSQFKIKNQKFKASLTLHKIDKTNDAAINNVTFDLYYNKTAFEEPSQGTKVTTKSTDDNGNVSFDLEKKGYYLVKETTNQGYEVEFKGTFEVKNSDYDKSFTLSDVTIRNGSTSNQSILNTRKKGKVTLKKVNEDQETLDGVKFKLYKEVDQSWLKELLTGKKYKMVEQVITEDGDNESGILSIEDLEWGNYKLEEVSTNGGYTILNDQGSANSVRFTIDRNNLEQTYYGTNSIVNKKNHVSILKTDNNGQTIEGAEFELTGVFADGTTSKTIKDQETLTGQLIAGNTYTLVETKAPNGYKLYTGEYQFKVESNGSTLTAISQDSHYSIDGTTIKASDDPISVSFTKNEGKLNGAEFTLTDTTDSSIAAKTFTIDGVKTLDLSEYTWIGGHSYKLEETKAPDGYKLADPIEFTVKKDGTINGETSININDDPIEITLKKTDAFSKDPLANVTFVVKQDNKEITRATTDTNGTLNFGPASLVQGQSYDLYEEVYNGYVREETKVQSFTVQTDGTIDQTGKSNIQLTNKRIPGVINVTKVDSAKKDKKLIGAQFTLYSDAACTKKVTKGFDGEKFVDGYNATLTTDSNGELSFKDLAWGTYYLKETKAPKGYKLNTSVYTITLNKSDTSVDVYADQEVVNEMNSISFVKTNGAKNLEGAQFELTGEFSDGSTKQTWTSTKDVHTITGLLINGNQYTLTETKAPDGYILPDGSSVTFTMNDNGTISMDESDQFTGNGGNLITVKDTETSITIHKIDNETQTNLAGAQLEIYKASDFDGDQPKEGAKAVKSWISSNEDYEIKGLVTGIEYVLYEKKSVSSYDSFTPIHFSLNADGTMKDQSSNVITAENKKIRAPFEITKKAESEDGIVSGIEFSLYSSDGTLMAEHLTTDENGLWSSQTSSESYTLDGKIEEFAKGLPTGQYYLKETKASNNTALSEDKYEFTIGDSDTGAMDTLIPVEIINTMFTSKVSLTKYDADSKKKLDGVQFELYLNGECIDSATTKDGTLSFDLHEKGEYTIKELKNEGYRSNDLFECSFVVDDEDQNQTIVINNDSRFTIQSGSVNKDGITNDPLTVVVEKKNENWQDLSGAEFVIRPKEGSSFVNGKDSLSLEEISSQLIEGNTYILSETKAPNGYKKANDVEFTVDSQGQITLITQKDYVRVKGLNTIEFKDEPVKKDTANTGVNTNLPIFTSTGIVSLCVVYFLWNKNRKK